MERIKEAIAKVGKTSAGVRQMHNFSVRQAETKMSSATPQQDTALSGIETVVLDRARLRTQRIVAFDSREPTCPSYDILRTRVAQVMTEHGWRTVAITSPNPQAGKTTIAINLALSLARLHESKTVLVDFDLRNPNISNYLGIKHNYNISDLINQKINLSDIAVKSDIGGLFIISNRDSLSETSELIGSRLASQFIEKLKSDFSDAFFVFDLPPMLVTDDALSLLPYMDSVLLVAAIHETRMADLQESEHKLENANYLGVVLNKALDASHGYSRY